MAKRESPFNQATLEAIAKALGHTDNGLTGPEIEHTLRTCDIRDVDPSNTKWKRLFNALAAEQTQKQWGNHVIGFIHYAMKPVRWSGKHAQYAWLRDELNKVLAFAGLELGEDGGVRRADSVKTLPEAEKRARSLRVILESRGVHPDVLIFCKAELLTNNYFHAVLEAAKSVASKIRTLSGLTSDGAELATQAFGLGKNGTPVLAINRLITDTEKGEQRGFTNLLIGLFGTFRNPTAHAEKIYWPISEQDALDILGLVSLLHRKLDLTTKLP
jgi:uncharacterized protein (TIGR02391 family)